MAAPDRKAPWQAANVFERVLQYARERDDAELFWRTLARTPLYLPGLRDDPAVADGGPRPGRGGTPVLVWPRDGRKYLAAFTSPDAITELFGGGVDGWRSTSLAEIGPWLPGPEWSVAVSPHTPIRAYLRHDELVELAEMLAAEPVFHPATPAEAAMFQAQRTQDPGTFLHALATSRLVLPLVVAGAPSELTIADAAPRSAWPVLAGTGVPTVAVFTSEQRRAEAPVGALPDTAATVDVVALAAAWPDPSWRLAINPGSAIAATFPGDRLGELARWRR